MAIDGDVGEKMVKDLEKRGDWKGWGDFAGGTVVGFDGINCTAPTTFPFPSPQEIEEFG